MGGPCGHTSDLGIACLAGLVSSSLRPPGPFQSGSAGGTWWSGSTRELRALVTGVVDGFAIEAYRLSREDHLIWAGVLGSRPESSGCAFTTGGGSCSLLNPVDPVQYTPEHGAEDTTPTTCASLGWPRFGQWYRRARITVRLSIATRMTITESATRLT